MLLKNMVVRGHVLGFLVLLWRLREGVYVQFVLIRAHV